MSGYFVRLSAPQRWTVPSPVSSMPWWRRVIRYLGSAIEGLPYSLRVRWHNWHASAYWARHRIATEVCDGCGYVQPVAVMRTVSNANGSDSRECMGCRDYGSLCRSIAQHWEAE